MSKSPLNTSKKDPSPVWTLPFEKKNYVYIAAGIGVIVLGFVLLSLGISTGWDNPLSVNVAPVVLVIGYCVIIPWAIMAGRKKTDN